MIRKLLLLIVCLSLSQVKGQDESTSTYGVLPTDIPTHNLVKYNRFYFNPTFSLVRENKKSINVYNKTQWAGFNDNPQTYLINYTANFDEKTGVSIGLHQQNEGIYRYFGGIANFAYNLELDDDMNFTFGLNLGFSQSGIKSNIDSATSTLLNNGVEVTDPVILNYENSSVFQLTPGVNFNYAEFDVGVSVVNLAAYNLSASELFTDNMAFTGHVMYTTSLERRSDKTIRGMAYANMLTSADDAESDSSLRYGGNVIVDLPELGWAQAGYNSFYGASVGIGGNITENVSVGYTYEMGLGDTSDFGSTHEIGLAYNFVTEKPRGRRSGPKSSTQKAYEERDSEIRRLKKEILEQNRIIRDLQQNGEIPTQEQRAMSELERSIAEAKEREAKAASELELKREEEVKLLNKEAEELAAQRELERQVAEQQAEEERLAAEKELERQTAEQKAEEERLAAQKDIEREVTEQETEEARIAAEEEAREAEAAQQQEEEERLAAQKEIERQEAEQKAEEERLAAQKEIERQIAVQQAEDDRKVQELIEQTRQVIATGDLDALRNQAQIVQASTILPEADMQSLTAELNTAIQSKEDAAARLAEEQRLAAEAEAARLAEEQRSVQQLIRETREIVASGDLATLRSQAEIVQASTILPEADKQSLTAELNTAIQAKETAAARLAEEQRLAAEAEAARLAEEQRQIQELITQTQQVIATGELDALRNQAQIVQSSTILPEADKQSLTAELNTAIQAKEEAAARLAEEQRLAAEAEAARLAEEQRQIQELITQTQQVIATGELDALRNQAQIVQASTILPEADKQSLTAELNTAIQAKEAAAARLAEEQRQVQELITQTRQVIATGELDALRNQAQIVQSSTILPEADKQSLTAELNAAIQAKEDAAAEAARLAEEERRRQEAAAAAAASSEDEEGLDEIKKELDNNARVSSKIFARRDSLLTTSLNVDKRGFNRLLESLVNMNDDAEEAKNSDPVSSKRLTASNRFVKFADATRPQAQYATKFIPGYPEGYYLIGNVFKGGTYAEKFTSTLKDLGFNDSQIIVNPENQFQYVAIESYTDKDEAARKYLSNIDNRYFGEMWILHIAKSRVESFKRLLQETKLITDTVKDDTVLTESLSYIGGHNIENGYYLITNIFKRENYFERGMAKLRDQGLEPQYFRNPKDNYIYVYLKRFDNLDEAKQSLFSNVNNSYSGDLYILKIQ
ncbi:PorP/SprF family type IX secretion system membrane protein [Aquimarina gracilis]|uniref:PorP/SprF family type IX secretion system membrane protein n=1 Tax=Aquimarina gracilis TaxID=874422 RepID=A0ABU6A135_9FLAO|nr:PorP/SprF family type IX secretion system membrane protein [Aquimarina gracilis]MEB3347780.1 PorP/SprF family type IX secretion system membrane protein [Aquimarina gracilis]